MSGFYDRIIKLSLFGKILFCFCISAGAALIVLMLPAVMSRIMNIGVFIGIAGGAALIAAGFAVPYAKGGESGKIRVLCRIYLAAAGIAVALMLTVSGFMLAVIFTAPEVPSDRTAVVLGCQVYDSGPSVMLKNRLDTAYEYLSASPDVVCIVSGGKGESEPVTEASAMKEYLVSRGIDESRILCEDKSATTEQNLEYSAKLIEEKGLSKSTVIISDGFHLARAKLIADKLGLDSRLLACDTPLHLLLPYWLREIAGVCYYAVA